MSQATLHREGVGAARLPARPPRWTATGDLVPGRDPTPRMMELVERMANGQTQKEAARELGGLSESGIRRLARVARERLGARTDPQLVAAAIYRGLLRVVGLTLVVTMQAAGLDRVVTDTQATEVARRMPERRGGSHRRDGRRGARRREEADAQGLAADDLALQLAADRGDTWDQLAPEYRQQLTVAVHVEAEQWTG